MSDLATAAAWWERDDLAFDGDHLALAGQRLEQLAKSAAVPIFAYSGVRLGSNLERLRMALAHLPFPSRILYAMKANRFLPVLTELRALGVDGIDACSPNEVLLARQAGFREDQISFTGTSVSNADLDALSRHPDVWVNLDSLSSIRRFGERCPGRPIGLRINPQAGVGYRQNEQLRYAGPVTTKFGIYPDQLAEALEIARKHQLPVKGIHLHAGCGYLNDQLENFRRVLENVAPFLRQIEGLEKVNLGGGLGIPLSADDEAIDLSRWTEVIASTLGGVNGEVLIEPGDYLVKDSGVLVLEVNTIERKNDRYFVGVNGGFNLHIEPAFYQLPLQPVPCRRRGGNADSPAYAIAGNINESLDVFDAGIELPGIREGDYLAFLNAGGYGSSMSSNHCMRGDFVEYLII